MPQGIGYPFAFARSYSSADLSTGRMGVGWHDSLSTSLEVDDDGDVLLHGENGQDVQYTKNDDGSFTAVAATATLTQTSDGYELVRHDQTHYVFDSSGVLQSIEDRNGHGLTLTYGGGHLTDVRDAAGRVFHLDYDGNGLISQLTAPDGRHVSYGYSDGQLTSVTDVRGKTWQYTYDSDGRLLSEQDPNGHYEVRNTYDSNTGRVTQQLDALGNASTFSWDAGSQTATTTDAAGKQWTDVYSNNALVARTDPLGNTTTYQYDQNGDPLKVTDGRGNATTMTYDDSGNMLTRTGPAPLSVSQSWTYTSFNDVKTATDARGKTTTYDYDDNGNLVKTTAPGGRVTSYTLDPAGTDLVTGVTDPRGKSMSFGYDAKGDLTSFTTPNGNKTTYTYNDAAQMTGRTSPRGNASGADPAAYTTTFAYDAAGDKTSETDPLGHTTTYAYDDAGNLTSVTDAAGKVWSYTYNEANDRVQATAPGGAATQYEYDARGSLTKVTSPLGHVTTYSYDDDGRLSSKVDPLGNVSGADPSAYTTSYSYDANGNTTELKTPGGGDTTYQYDVNNRPVVVTDANTHASSYGYDPNGNVTSVTDPNGNATTYTYDDANNRSTQTQYATSSASAYAADVTADNPALYWRLDETSGTTAADASGNNQTGAYVGSPALGSAGALTGDRAAAFNGSSQYAQLVSPNLPTGSSPRSVELWFETTSSNEQALFDYGSLNSGQQFALFLTGSNSLMAWGWGGGEDQNFNSSSAMNDGHWHQIVETYDGSNLTLYLDGTSLGSHGVSLNTVVNAHGFNVGVSDPGGNDSNSNRYCACTIDEVAVYPTALSAAQVQTHYAAASSTTLTTTYAYDLNRNETAVTDPLGHTTTFAYDDDGNLTTTVDPLGNVSGGSASAHTVSYGYDADGNRVSITDQNGHETTLTYDANNLETSGTDPNHNTTTWTYDSLGRLDTVEDPTHADTHYSYDDLGNLTDRTDANGHTTSYGYDADNELTSVTDPLSRKWTYAYDANGNLTTRTDARANDAGDPALGTTSYGYDPAGRVTSINYSDGTPSVSYTYDGVGNRLTMTDGGGSVTYTYDPNNNLATVTRGSNQFTYGYDSRGDLTSETYPDGTAVAYGYDNASRLTSVSSGGATTSYGYDAAGELTTSTLPGTNGYVEQRSYDPAGELTSLRNANGSSTLSAFAYSYDDNGNPTKVVRTGTAAGTSTFTYDAVNRLTGVCEQASPCGSGDPATGWTYDDVGNRLTQTTTAGTTSYSYDAADELTHTGGSGGSVDYGYDPDGRETSAGSSTFAYNAAGELTSGTVGGATASFSYDGDGLRLSKTSGGATVEYRWDVAQQVPEIAIEAGAGGEQLRRYVYGLDRISMTTPAGDFYYHYDGLGSVANVTDSAGATQWTYGYDPYGTATATQVATDAPVNPMQFAGEYADSELGQSYLRARQYDPSTGRFLQTDPRAPELSDPYVAAYVYADDLPTALVDPLGESGVPVLGPCSVRASRSPLVSTTRAARSSRPGSRCRSCSRTRGGWSRSRRTWRRRSGRSTSAAALPLCWRRPVRRPSMISPPVSVRVLICVIVRVLASNLRLS